MRSTTQHAWPGWLEAVPADGTQYGTQYRLTWNDWCARQRQHLQPQPDRSAAATPGQREIAARAFLVWFDATAGVQREPPFDDRELAVRRYMHSFEEVAATRR